MRGTNALAYYRNLLITTVISFIVQPPGLINYGRRNLQYRLFSGDNGEPDVSSAAQPSQDLLEPEPKAARDSSFKTFGDVIYTQWPVL